MVSTLVCKGGFQEKGGVSVYYICVCVCTCCMYAYVWVCMCVTGVRLRRTHAGIGIGIGFVGWEESAVVDRQIFIHSQTANCTHINTHISFWASFLWPQLNSRCWRHQSFENTCTLYACTQPPKSLFIIFQHENVCKQCAFLCVSADVQTISTAIGSNMTCQLPVSLQKCYTCTREEAFHNANIKYIDNTLRTMNHYCILPYI